MDLYRQKIRKQCDVFAHQDCRPKCPGSLELIILPETNIAPKNGWLEYEFPFGMAYFQVLWYRMLVSGSVSDC